MPSVARTVPRHEHALFHATKQKAEAPSPKNKRFTQLNGLENLYAFSCATRITAVWPGITVSGLAYDNPLNFSKPNTAIGIINTIAQKNILRVARTVGIPSIFILDTNSE